MIFNNRISEVINENNLFSGLIKTPSVNWHDDQPLSRNLQKLGGALANSGDLFRRPGHEGGLFLVLPDGTPKCIASGKALSAVITDRLDLRRMQDGKKKATRVPASLLGEALLTETFLSLFPRVDRITSQPEYLPGFRLSKPGYNDGGEGHRFFFVGCSPKVSTSNSRINAFLDAMDFATEADRANSVAGLLTVMLRHHWPGGKPIILATASKSHSGKDTVLDFIAGKTPKVSISWERADWTIQKAIVEHLKTEPSLGMIRLENARVSGNQTIASAFVERFVTEPSPTLFSPGSGVPLRIRNEVVMAISTNFGVLSGDLLNRGLPIHLEPKGDVHDRRSPIGDPRDGYLPRYRDEIAAEAHGMIERWRDFGMPLDHSKHHSRSEWAKVVGGILMVNGVEGFLDNYGLRRVEADPIRNGIAVLGANLLNRWLPVSEVVDEVNRLGLKDPLIPRNERTNHESQKRGLGVMLRPYVGEKFVIPSNDSDTEGVRFQLLSMRKRFGGTNAPKAYGFIVVDKP